MSVSVKSTNDPKSPGNFISAIPHDHCASDACLNLKLEKSEISSDCLNSTQACRMSRGSYTQVKENLGNMTENMQAYNVQRR